MANISQYHGKISECSCGIHRHPEKQSERSCRFCFGRGFVAECTACEGKGQLTTCVNGTDVKLGTMKATCNCCGGVGLFGVNKPADWADEVKAEPETAVA
jgi:hypothetical protein